MEITSTTTDRKTSIDEDASPDPTSTHIPTGGGLSTRGSTELRLDFHQVTKRYGDRTVVDDLTFEVQPGRVTGFLGPNGSGKSTTMKILLDLAAADHGAATIGGIRYRDLPDPASTVGVMIEPNAFHPGRSGRRPPCDRGPGSRSTAHPHRRSPAFRRSRRRARRPTGRDLLGSA